MKGKRPKSPRADRNDRITFRDLCKAVVCFWLIVFLIFLNQIVTIWRIGANTSTFPLHQTIGGNYRILRTCINRFLETAPAFQLRSPHSQFSRLSTLFSLASNPSRHDFQLPPQVIQCFRYQPRDFHHDQIYPTENVMITDNMFDDDISDRRISNEDYLEPELIPLQQGRQMLNLRANQPNNGHPEAYPEPVEPDAAVPEPSPFANIVNPELDPEDVRVLWHRPHLNLNGPLYALEMGQLDPSHMPIYLLDRNENNNLLHTYLNPEYYRNRPLFSQNRLPLNYRPSARPFSSSSETSVPSYRNALLARRSSSSSGCNTFTSNSQVSINQPGPSGISRRGKKRPNNRSSQSSMGSSRQSSRANSDVDVRSANGGSTTFLLQPRYPRCPTRHQGNNNPNRFRPPTPFGVAPPRYPGPRYQHQPVPVQQSSSSSSNTVPTCSSTSDEEVDDADEERRRPFNPIARPNINCTPSGSSMGSVPSNPNQSAPVYPNASAVPVLVQVPFHPPRNMTLVGVPPPYHHYPVPVMVNPPPNYSQMRPNPNMRPVQQFYIHPRNTYYPPPRPHAGFVPNYAVPVPGNHPMYNQCPENFAQRPMVGPFPCPVNHPAVPPYCPHPGCFVPQQQTPVEQPMNVNITVPMPHFPVVPQNIDRTQVPPSSPIPELMQIHMHMSYPECLEIPQVRGECSSPPLLCESPLVFMRRPNTTPPPQFFEEEPGCSSAPPSNPPSNPPSPNILIPIRMLPLLNPATYFHLHSPPPVCHEELAAIPSTSRGLPANPAAAPRSVDVISSSEYDSAEDEESQIIFDEKDMVNWPPLSRKAGD